MGLQKTSQGHLAKNLSLLSVDLRRIMVSAPEFRMNFVLGRIDEGLIQKESFGATMWLNGLPTRLDPPSYLLIKGRPSH